MGATGPQGTSGVVTTINLAGIVGSPADLQPWTFVGTTG
jgi:hypothetical protein